MSTTTSKLGLFKPELTDEADITAMNQNWDKIDAAISELQAPPQYIHYTLVASGWTGDSAPYTYTIDGYDGETVEVVESMTMTLDQLTVIESAKIKSDPSANENILYAFGYKPTIDIPVMLVVR